MPGGQATPLRKGIDLILRAATVPARVFLIARSNRLGGGHTRTARRDGWAFPSHYILIGPLQVIIGPANIRRGCRSRRPKEKMADPAARTSKHELGLQNYLKTLSIIRELCVFDRSPGERRRNTRCRWSHVAPPTYARFLLPKSLSRPILASQAPAIRRMPEKNPHVTD